MIHAVVVVALCLLSAYAARVGVPPRTKRLGLAFLRIAKRNGIKRTNAPTAADIDLVTNGRSAYTNR